MPIKTRIALEEAIRGEIDRLWLETNDRIKDLSQINDNPQVDIMLVKNKGYLLALEDMNEFIMSKV